MKKILLLLFFYLSSLSSVFANNDTIHLKCEGKYDYGNGYSDHSFQSDVIIYPSTKILVLPVEQWKSSLVIENQVDGLPLLGGSKVWPAAKFELRISDDKYRGFRDISNHDIFLPSYLNQIFSVNRKDLSFSSLLELSDSSSLPNINGYIFIVGQCNLNSKQENLI